jgi:hypothetical protein
VLIFFKVLEQANTNPKMKEMALYTLMENLRTLPMLALANEPTDCVAVFSTTSSIPYQLIGF